MREDGGPAFPWGQEIRGGMTLRDYFAGQALSSGMNPHIDNAMDLAAKWAYEQADAMIRFRDESTAHGDS